MLLGAVLAGLGAVRLRRVSMSGSLVLAGVLAVPATASAHYSAAQAAQRADSTANALRAGAARWRPEGRPVDVVPSGSVLLSPAELAGAIRGIAVFEVLIGQRVEWTAVPRNVPPALGAPGRAGRPTQPRGPDNAPGG